MKTFLSIGAGPGMGLATAERFGREGYQVILAARTKEKTEALAAQLVAKGIKAVAQTVDATDPASIQNLFKQVAASHGRLDVVHYNAATLRASNVQDQPANTFNADLAVNIGGALTTAQSTLSALSGHGGSLLLTGGGFGLAPSPDYLSLSIGKAGIRALALGLFDSARALGVHVATVTVAAFIDPGSKEAQDVAEHFWELHSQPIDAWKAEVIYPTPA
ncbi:SDR family NAD(P)-dependent oxidoreductase [Pseudomonas sp. BN605]|uniref:SDR family oxidoreductase n=1 Tax=Pseudomonas sp. BN605 TaxID=2567893 RepID=UPI0024575456|nr:SDR family NAD(P)-dependent oxidoreductase [Pseudomonas sp. BN605]MDH4847995.1 SDR family NAD(P)-dependent oxidoreductase [Pseudomonas sp. BN605]